VGGTLFYGGDDGRLHRRSFDGSTTGPEQPLEPYHDAVWRNVQTGSGQTYDGVSPGLYGDVLSGVTGMFYARGRLYYTRSGRTELFSRYFTPESGVVGAQEVANSSVTLPAASGMFLDDAANRLYVARASDGALLRYTWRDAAQLGVPARASGSPTVVSSKGEDWSARALFNLP